MTRDVLTRSIDTLFVLARLTLKVSNPKTFITAFEHLSRATTILESLSADRRSSASIQEIDMANYTRCVSGAFYNIAGTLYQASRYGNAVPFLIHSCTLGEKALHLPRSSGETTESREKEWKQLEDQLYRRWELLGVCYTKNEDRKVVFTFHSSH